MGWIQALWIIVGSLGAIACVGASVFCFVTGHSGIGVGSLLLAPVRRGARVFLAVLVGAVYLIYTALSY